ncbi:MAG TPA: hypothetical protein VH442_13160 [Micromonosporaceae bacterium]|jgi:hypothetical protein
MVTRPTLLNSCAFAATASEARFRINGAPQPPRSTRVVALDSGAAAVVRDLAQQPWAGTRFLRYEVKAASNADGIGTDGRLADIVLESADGPVRLTDELIDADFMMMIATANDGAYAASAIGSACVLRGIMTAGVIVGDGHGAHAAVNALRPHARVLLVTNDRTDIAGIMSAVGA